MNRIVLMAKAIKSLRRHLTSDRAYSLLASSPARKAVLISVRP